MAARQEGGAARQGVADRPVGGRGVGRCGRGSGGFGATVRTAVDTADRTAVRWLVGPPVGEADGLTVRTTVGPREGSCGAERALRAPGCADALCPLAVVDAQAGGERTERQVAEARGAVQLGGGDGQRPAAAVQPEAVETVGDGPAADPWGGLQHGDRHSRAGQMARGGEPGRTGPHDDDVHGRCGAQHMTLPRSVPTAAHPSRAGAAVRATERGCGDGEKTADRSTGGVQGAHPHAPWPKLPVWPRGYAVRSAV